MRHRIIWTALTAALFLVAAAFAEMGQSGQTRDMGGSGPVVVAHRAGAALGPENTLAALERAIEVGADMAEVDVRLTSDGIPVALHDESLGRTACVDKAVKDMSLSQVLALEILGRETKQGG